MTRQRKTSSAKRKQTQKTRSSRIPKRSKATWQDPNAPTTRISKGKKTTAVKKNQSKDSCWWFGWE
jgi:hypothetical protein